MLLVTEEARKRALIERWQTSRDQRAFNQLEAMHRHIIDGEARRFDRDYDVYFAAGLEGFMQAVNEATPDTASFAGHCRTFIRRRIIDEWRSSEAAERGIGLYLDKPPETNPMLDDIQSLPTTLRAELIDQSPSPEWVAIDRLDVGASLELLSPKQRRVIEAIYFEDLTQFEAAQAIGIDQRHVQRLLKQALSIMRAG